MKTLEELIRDAAAEGRLSGVSIVKDRSGRGWQANAPSRDGGGAWTVAICADPAEALMRAFGVLPAASAAMSEEDMLG